MAMQVLLYSADAPDKVLAPEDVRMDALTGRQLLWIDIGSPEAAELEQVRALLGGAPGQLDLAEGGARPGLVNYGDCFRIQAKAVCLPHSTQPMVRDALTLLVGQNYVVTVHPTANDFLDKLRKREQGDSTIGALSSESFAASLLDWLLDTYFRAVDVLVRDIDRIEVLILGRQAPPEDLTVLVAARRHIADLRRMLKEHRDVFYGMARPDFMATEGDESRSHFEALNQHFERVEDELENARDLVVGSFELLATRVAQKTNDTMRVLTFVTVLMGLLALVAGLLGMNFALPIFDSGMRGFLIVVGAMLGFALLAVGLAHARRWF